MSQDELSRIWAWRYKALHADVAGLKAEMLWVRSRLAPNTTSLTPSSLPSSSSPTGLPSPIRSALSRAAEKMGREALMQFGLWLLAVAFKWIAPWLLAWWAMGGAVMRFLERWAPFLLG
jgi:hypothetical protein